MAARARAGAGRPPRPPEAHGELELVPDLVWTLLLGGNRARRDERDEPVRAERRAGQRGPAPGTERRE